MTLYMRDQEQKRLGEKIKDVKIVKKLSNEYSIQKIAEILEVTEEFCMSVITLSEEHPDWDDEDIAEELSDEE